MSNEHKGGANQVRRRAACLRGGLIASAVLAGAASLSGVVPLGEWAPQAYGATFPSGLQTGFVINNGSSNANKTAATLPDQINWDNIFKPTLSLGSQVTPTFVPSPPYTTAGNLRSSGIFEGTFYYDDGDPNQCSGANRDPTANQTNQTIDFNPWVPAPANVQDKANICTAAYAMEALSDATGVRHFILYGYFTRAAGNGSVSIDTVFHSPTPGRCGDLMLDMQFPEKTAQFLDWRPASGNCNNVNGPGSWAPSGRTVDFVAATGVRTEGYPVANQQQNTFGEFGIDLTSAGLFGDSQCSTFSLTQTLSRTGSASALNTAAVADFLVSPRPLDISNCGTLSVTKRTPVGHTSDNFGFTVTNESSQGVVIPPSQTSITDTLQSGQTKTYDRVLSSSLLRLDETTIPPPWEKQSAVCSYNDAAGATHSVDVTNPATPFTLLGGGHTNCVITDSSALVTVRKITLPAFSPERFAFDVGGRTADLGNGQSESFAVPSGTPITMTETVPAGWETPSITCDAVSSHPDPQSATVTPILGHNIICTFTNTQHATVTIEKRVPAVHAGASFDFTTDLGTPSHFTLTPNTPVAGGWVNDERTFDVVPGNFSVSEEEPTGFVLADLFCFDTAYGTETPPFPGPTATVDARPGSRITCSFTDATGGTLVIDKVTEPTVEFDQDFPFTVTGPTEFTPSSFNLNTIGADYAHTLTDLPGGDYTIAEEQLPGWTNTDVTCTDQTTGETLFEGVPPNGDGTVTVPVDAAAVVRCTYTNRAAPAELTLRKTVANVGSQMPWHFDVSLSPGTSVSPSPATLSGTGPGSPDTAHHPWHELIPGHTYVISEAAQTGWDMGDITCTDQNGEEVTNEGPAGRTFTFTAQVGQELSCSMSNAGLPSQITLTKITAGIDGTETWNFPLQISPVPTGETQTKEASGTGLEAVDLSWDNLVPGQRYDIIEPNLPAYVTQHLSDCAGATTIPGGLTFIAPLDATVNCTLRNLVAPVEATFTKTSDTNGTFTFRLDNLDLPDDLPREIPVTTSSGTGKSAAFDLTAGSRYSLEEEPREGFTGGPITCSVTPVTGEPFDIPDITDFTVRAGDRVACHASNRSTHTVTLRKDWVDAAEDDTAGLSINGATTAPGFAVSTASGRAGTQQDTTNQATAVVTAGDQVTVTETLPAADLPANTGTYITTLACSTPAGPVHLTTVSDDRRDATFSMPVNAVTCVFANTRTTHELTLEKFWENGAAGDTATLSINRATAPPGSVTAIVPATSGGTGTSTQVATDDAITAGATVTVTETLPATGKPANTGTYDSALVCSTPTGTVTVTPADPRRTGTFTMPEETVVCVFTNVRVPPATITTVPSPARGAAGTAFHDAARVAGSAGIEPAGTVTFEVFGPDNAACHGAPIFAVNVRLSSDHTARTSTAFTPAVTGTYRWVVIFHSANAYLTSARSGCQEERIHVVRRAHPSPPPPVTPVTG